MYEIIINTDKWIFLALSTIVLILLAMVYKYVFKQEPVVATTGSTGASSSASQQKNIDFFNTKVGNIGKTTSIFVEKENKHYYLIDMGNNRVLIMEEDFHEPEVYDIEMAKQIVGEGDIDIDDIAEEASETNEMDQHYAAQIMEDQEEEDADVEFMMKVHDKNNRSYNEQKTLFNEITGNDDDDYDGDDLNEEE